MSEGPVSAITSALLALGTAMGQTQPAFQAAGDGMTEVSRRLREQIFALRQDTRARQQRLSPPFADIRIILTSGEAYDGNGNYLLTLAPEGIEDLFRRLNEVELRETLDGPGLRHKNRFPSQSPRFLPQFTGILSHGSTDKTSVLFLSHARGRHPAGQLNRTDGGLGTRPEVPIRHQAFPACVEGLLDDAVWKVLARTPKMGRTGVHP